jgi:hypothetical protein
VSYQEGRTDTTKLILAFRSFAKAPKKKINHVISCKVIFLNIFHRLFRQFEVFNSGRLTLLEDPTNTNLISNYYLGVIVTDSLQVRVETFIGTKATTFYGITLFSPAGAT